MPRSILELKDAISAARQRHGFDSDMAWVEPPAGQRRVRWWRAFEGAAILSSLTAAILALQANQLARESLDATTFSNSLAREALQDQKVASAYQILSAPGAAAAVKLRAIQILAGYGEPIVGADIVCPSRDTLADDLTCSADGFTLGKLDETTVLTNSRLVNLRLSTATFLGVAFGNVEFGRTQFAGGQFIRVQFRGTSLTNTMFELTAFNNVQIENADLSEADLSGAIFFDVIAPYTNLSDVKFCHPSSETGNRLQALETGTYDKRRSPSCLTILDANDDTFAQSWYEDGHPPMDGPGTGLVPIKVGWICDEGTVPPIDADDGWFGEMCTAYGVDRKSIRPSLRLD